MYCKSDFFLHTTIAQHSPPNEPVSKVNLQCSIFLLNQPTSFNQTGGQRQVKALPFGSFLFIQVPPVERDNPLEVIELFFLPGEKSVEIIQKTLYFFEITFLPSGHSETSQRFLLASFFTLPSESRMHEINQSYHSKIHCCALIVAHFWKNTQDQ